MKKILIVTPFYPYPAEKNGGIHTLNALIKNMPNRKVDIFYYGEEKVEEINFSENINKVYHENLLKKCKLCHLLSILNRSTFSSYRFNKYSEILKELSKKEYDEVYLDQYSSCIFANYFYNKTRLINIAHDSMPLYFERKRNLSNSIISKIYYYLQVQFSKKEEKKFYKFFSRIAYLCAVDVEYEKKLWPEYEEKFFESNIGIDIDKVETAEKINLPNNTIVFTGVMNYEPNNDAMMYFIENIWDKLLSINNNINLYIVGKNPKNELIELSKLKKNITVTGIVDDVFSYIKSSTIYISPLRFGTGKKNKVLEAIACKTPLIASNVSLEGFDSMKDFVLIANNEEEWINKIIFLLNNKEEYNNIKMKMNQAIKNEYSWKEIAKKLVD